ncbi:uncharacterized protein EI97DRAFT_462489 [Westerdykella ornata]|uniref:Cytochrome oxidase c assembly domain-containing protein n=1 Tax=Westerdykella ornata TaxID=318751 RepID=A0A6A6J5C4_WESOR|nr:uncharacterized protein EI97DRAFT_462489 [Westerdykella ornata]KAF2271790.1 hypothetical protein EI97DRAFT_462489 [Westerdykella ornata]
MSRSPRESTRFTATGVWAHTKPGGRSTILQFADPAPENETPAQKVKRLREAANRAKMAQVTKWDVAYFYGRRAADFMHRATVYGIVFATGCFGVMAVFSVGDMVVYNRRRRAEWYKEQEAAQARILQTARDAVHQGIATPAQRALVEGIAEEEALWEKKKAERKAPSKLLWWMHGEWNEEKELAEQRRLAVQEFQKKEEEAAKARGLGITQAVQEARVNSSPQSAHAVQSAPAVGGPLDQAAANAASSVEKTSKGWFGWVWGGSKKSE